MDRLQAYNLLGLADGADEDAVKNAYRQMAQKYNVDNYEAGPLREEAEQKMNELNQAFDLLMSYLRTGKAEATQPVPPQGSAPGYGPAPGYGTPPPPGTGTVPGHYPAIRKLINAGQIDEALAELSAMSNGPADAEWNFLMGSAYYYKGWLDQALVYFQQAVRLAPGNREYEAALRNLQGSRDGNMQGNPYGGQSGDAAALNCACNTCTLMCCMDACCNGCR